MASIVCDGEPIEARDGEPLLDSLLRAGVSIAHSCRAGICQSCLIKATRGTPPAPSQAGLRPALVQQNFLLSCVARPVDDLDVVTDAASGLTIPARVTDVSWLSADVARVTLHTDSDLGHRAGQYVTLLRDDGLARSYSIASATGDRRLELHVRVLPDGRMSRWLPTAAGADVRLRGPAGDCFYSPVDVDQPLFLAGTGTGLAPLWGIVQDALAHGHRGPIVLVHGGRTPAGLYLRAELRALATEHGRFTYVPCVLEGADADVTVGRLDEVVSGLLPKPAGQQVFLCGDPDLVRQMKRRLYLAGAKLADLHADPFVNAPPSLAVPPAT